MHARSSYLLDFCHFVIVCSFKDRHFIFSLYCPSLKFNTCYAALQYTSQLLAGKHLFKRNNNDMTVKGLFLYIQSYIYGPCSLIHLWRCYRFMLKIRIFDDNNLVLLTRISCTSYVTFRFREFFRSSLNQHSSIRNTLNSKLK